MITTEEDCQNDYGKQTTVADVINIDEWSKQNFKTLQKRRPICNKLICQGKDFCVMAVAGENKRKDYHVSLSEEWFLQYKGLLKLKCIIDGELKEININEGDMYLLPRCIPHQPNRAPNSLGFVLEKSRLSYDLLSTSKDELRWYCENCIFLLHAVKFECKSLEGSLEEILEKESRKIPIKCIKCGYLNNFF